MPIKAKSIAIYNDKGRFTEVSLMCNFVGLNLFVFVERVYTHGRTVWYFAVPAREGDRDLLFTLYSV